VKSVKVTCDQCGKRIRQDSDGGYQHASLRMLVHGYGMQDGDHRHRWHICSAVCGLKLLKNTIRDIEATE
jgi:hypothetical protein